MSRKRTGPIAIEAPAHLSERSRKLWAEVAPQRRQSPEALAAVQVALEALDRADEAAALLKRDGLVIVSAKTGVVHASPLLKVELQSRQLFFKIWSAMSLTFRLGTDEVNELL